MKPLISIIMLSALNLSVFSQELKIDLTSKNNITQTVNPQIITTITILNRLPNPSVKYEINIEKHHTQTPILTIPAGLSSSEDSNATVDCINLLNAKNTLDGEKDESNISSEVTSLLTEIKNADPTKCKNTIESANSSIYRTHQTILLSQPMILNKNETITVTIKRSDNTWTYEFQTEHISHWTTYYGFTYIPDVLTKFPNYYANQQTGGSYLISKMNGSNKNVLQNVSPTAMFTYRFFDKKPDQILKFGLTGGIFYNTEILGAMFGPSLVIADNVTINTGISFVQKYKLKGQYKDGQTIQDNLDFDQLHDKIWTNDMFISIGFNIPELFTKKSTTAAASTPASTTGK